MNILCIDSVTKSFKKNNILNDIYLKIETGEIIGILGRNGSGKSTLFNIIFGIRKSDTQFIKLNETILQTTAQRKNKIVYLPQYSFLPKNISIKKIINLFCDQKNAAKISELNFIKPFINEKPKNISFGELRFLEAVLIIHSQSEFVILDEPFQSLSPKMIFELLNMIKTESKNKGFLISDHQYSYVVEISSKIYTLSNGYLKYINNLNELELQQYLQKNI